MEDFRMKLGLGSENLAIEGEREKEHQEIRFRVTDNSPISYSSAFEEHAIQEAKHLTGITPPSTGGGAWPAEREHMFDKVVTPSDVGKLNRLVIPKQQAEKYFPLHSSAADKGLVLNFEDRTGKSWRFRYSYWSSSQSYVMTKGWSRFVKEKKLDAGDIVSFDRWVGELGNHSYFIDWKHRPADGGDRIYSGASSLPLQLLPHAHFLVPPPLQQFGRFCQLPPNKPVLQYPNHLHLQIENQRLSCRNSSGNLVNDGAMNFEQGLMHHPQQIAAVDSNFTAPKRLRLFGVNMDCSIPEESQGIGFTPELPPLPLVSSLRPAQFKHEFPGEEHNEDGKSCV